MKIRILVLFILFWQAGFAGQDPSVQYTSVPDWGKSNSLAGRVHNTTLSDHGIAVYIYIEEAGGWWTKPTSANPVTLLQPDSSFTANIVTGGLDQFATQIIAFLIPLSFSPPVLLGGNLPGSLLSYPYAIQCRPHGERLISWSGFDWIVKKSVGSALLPLGPGPNIFNDNDSMVWVDNQHRLHLRIARNGNAWHCSEVICKASQGYNKYAFDVAGRVDLLDPDVVAGMFTWDDCSPFAHPPNAHYREIDFEFSRWGLVNDLNSQFVIQPWDVVGNRKRFNMDLNGLTHSVHFFNWTPDSIFFMSVWGDSSYSWKYTNSTYLPTPRQENVRINLWLIDGKPPLDNGNAEIILNSFQCDITTPGNTNDRVKIFPNPVEYGCVIDVYSDSSKNTEIGIIDLQGNLVRTLFSGKLITGANRIEWNGMDENAKTVHSGMYLIYIKDKVETRYFKVIKL